MDIRKYIETGILELYCLNDLSAEEKAEVQRMMVYPEIRDEINKIQLAIETYAADHAIPPPAYLQDKIGNVIENLEKEDKMHPTDLPLINKFSNYRAWLELVQNDIPETFNDKRYCKKLTSTPALTQLLVVSATDFEDEVHTDLLESFLILKGECDCTVGNNTLHMKAGSFMNIPLHAHHDVKVRTPFVVAILQRIAV